MKKSIFLFTLLLFLCQFTLAQTGGINFQGLARNASGEVLINQKITLRFTVLLSSETGNTEYQESKEATTNAQGMFSLVIGEGSILTKTGNFSDINWKVSPKFLKVEMDPSAGANFTLMGTSKLQAVPFAYYANGVDAENVQGVLPAEKGGTGVGSISALKGALQLDQVSNTSDTNKPLSSATQSALASKVDKVQGKELSTNDYTTAEKTKLAAITGTNTGDQDLSGFATTADLNSKANTSDVATALETKVDKVQGKDLSTNDYTTAEKTKLAAITGTNTGDQDLSGFATTADLNSKANASDVTTALVTKVDKVQGKELSTNDYTTAEKAKLAAITGTNTGDQDLSGYATTADLATKASTASVTTSLNLKEDVSNKSILTDLGGQSTSDALYPSQKAVKTYVDTQINNGGIADGSISSQKITDGTLTNADINTSAAIAYGKLDLTGSIVASDISSTAAIPFSKLAILKSDVMGLGIPGSDTNTTYSAGSGLTLSGTTFSIGSGAITSTEIADGTLTNADITSSAAIAYGKLDLTGSIVASDISSTAAIPFSKLAISKSDVMGLGIPGSDTNTTYSAGSGLTLSGTTFSIGSGAITSTEIADGTLTNADITSSAAIAYGKLDLTGSIVASDISSTAAIPFSKLAISKSDVMGLGIPGSDTNTTYSAGSGLTLSGTTFSIGSGAITSTEIADATITNSKISGPISVAKGGTGSNSLTLNNVILGNGTDAVQFIAPGPSGNVLKSNGTTWISDTNSGGVSSLDQLSDAKIQGGSAFGSYDFTGGVLIGHDSLTSLYQGKATTAIGIGVVKNLNNGWFNTAVGYHSMKLIFQGSGNTAVGSQSLYSVYSGSYNTAMGELALNKNTGSQNTALGSQSMQFNTTGTLNVAIGNQALQENISGQRNTAIGFASLVRSTGDHNTAAGYNSLYQNTSGTQNSGFGAEALGSLTTGNQNTAIGYQAGLILNSGSNNIIIGYNAQPSLSTISNQITLGNSSITSLRAQVTSITSLSDRRDKTNIFPIAEGLDFIKQLKPVTFTWDTRDKAKVGIKSAGFIAQDLLALQKASAIGENLDLVSENNPEKLEARYANLLPVMVKAMQEQQAIIEQLKLEIEALKKLVKE